MSVASADQLVHTYVEGWKTGDREKILGTLDPECVIIESYGPTYRGREMVGRWIDSWHAPGNRVERWDVTSLFVSGDVCFFEWVFECTYDGERAGFEGASIAHVRDGKLVTMREYATTAPRYEWQG
jgi:ketosteroid isomerase-like protein